MAIYAHCGGIEAVLNEAGDELTLQCGTTFWNASGGLTSNYATVNVPVDPDGTILAYNDAITDAVVAHASSEYSWTLPRNHFTFHQLVRGLII